MLHLGETDQAIESGHQRARNQQDAAVEEDQADGEHSQAGVYDVEGRIAKTGHSYTADHHQSHRDVGLEQ